MSSNALLQLLASKEVSESLLFWVQAVPIKECRQIKSLSELRDTLALTEILCEIDEQFFKELRSGPSQDTSLWLLNLVQLKKLFLKLSSFVELRLNQDWSLLPVPDFKAVAQGSTEALAHLNFVVAAVLMTATHSGRSVRLLEVFNSISGPHRPVIEEISEGFMIALSGKKSTNSPRKSAFQAPLPSAIQPKRLFPASADTEEIPFKPLENESKPSTLEPLVRPPSPKMPLNPLTPIDSSVSTTEELQSELRILKLQNDELMRKLKLAQDRDALEAEAREVLIETQTQLFLLQDQMHELRSQRDFERLERNTLQASFDAERAALEESLNKLKKEIESVKEVKEERDWLQAALDRLQKEKETLELQLTDARAKENQLKQFETNQVRLLAALKKGQHFVLKQNEKIRELEACVGNQNSELEQLRLEVERLRPFEPPKEPIDLILL